MERVAGGAQSVGARLCRIRYLSGWQRLLAGLFLAALTISIVLADTTAGPILLPIEVLGADGTTVSRTVALQAGQAESVRSLWLQIHGLRYADQASVQINTSAWIPLNNNTVTIAEPGKSYGGIGGGFSTLVMTLPLPNGTVVSGDNTIRFRFNHTDGVVSTYRVLAWNFLTVEGRRSSRRTILRRMHPKTGRHPCPMRLLFWRGENFGTPPHWRQAASPIVRGFRRTVPTVMRRMGAT